MKTLVITGAARKNGHTNQMVQLFLDTLGGEYTIIDAYRAENIAPCKDCRYCWHKKGCSIHDGMDEVYRLLEEADNVVLASPMYKTYKQYGNLIMDVFEAIDNNFEFALDYKKGKGEFSKYEITEVFVLED